MKRRFSVGRFDGQARLVQVIPWKFVFSVGEQLCQSQPPNNSFFYYLSFDTSNTKMSFGVPLMKPTMEGKKEHGLRLTSHGVHDTLSFGFCKVKESVATVHPLESSEKKYARSLEEARFASCRNLQGLAAPLKMSAELRATRRTGRLPFLESSGLSTATLNSGDDTIDFSDILGLPEHCERHLVPHVVMGRQFGDL